MEFEGVLPLRIPFEIAGVSNRRRFYNELKVEGGKKMLYPSEVEITPYRDDRIVIYVTNGLYRQMKKIAERKGLRLSEWIRRILEEKMVWYIQAESKKLETGFG